MKFPRKIKDAAPCSLTRADIERLAEVAAEKLGYETRSDPAPIGAKLGIRVTRTTPVEEHDDEMIAFADGKVVLSLIDASLLVDGRTQRNREASDMAKAIGHLILHLPVITTLGDGTAMVVARYPSDKQGKLAAQQAHWFAAAFLAPSDAIREISSRGANKGDVAQTLMERHFLCRTLASARVHTVLGGDDAEERDVVMLDA